MASMLVSSSEQYSGKSSLCLGLGVLLKERGYKVGYMKPIGNLLIDVNGSLADEDAQGIRKLLDTGRYEFHYSHFAYGEPH